MAQEIEKLKSFAYKRTKDLLAKCSPQEVEAFLWLLKKVNEGKVQSKHGKFELTMMEGHIVKSDYSEHFIPDGTIIKIIEDLN